MKIIHNFFIMIFVSLSACQVTTLTDKSANSFVVTASQGTTTDNSIEVKWIKTDYYANFVVLRSTSETGTYTPITHRINASEYIDTYNIIEGTSYYYKVQGYNDIGTVMYLTEFAEGYAGSGGGFFPPKNITINTGQAKDSLELKWDRAEGATAYGISRSEDVSFFPPYDENNIVTLLHYEDTDVEAGKTYYYQITSLKENKDNKTEYTPSPNRSDWVKGTLFGADLGLSSPAGEYDNKIVLTWKKYEFATRYLIFRSESSEVPENPIKIVSQSEVMEYADTDVEAGKLYYYTIMYQNDSGTLDQSDTIRSYLKTAGTPEKPTDFIASQGLDPNDVVLNWTAADRAASYEIERSTSATGPWQIIKKTTEITYKDRVPDDSYTYFYRVTGLNPAPGTASDIKEGWANKAPINITASTFFGEKVILEWDKVPNARSYVISFSDTYGGTYEPVGSISPSSSSDRISFDHIYDIGSSLSKELFYKVQVVTTSGQSLPSEPVAGIIKKIDAPQNISVRNNKTATKSMEIRWDNVANARSYNVYRATLSHKGSNPDNLEVGHFKFLGNSQNAAFGLNFNTYPIRRYVYMVKAVDRGGAEGVFTKTDVVWRYPVDLVDFAKDVDYTIVQAQTQIPNFGQNGSGATIQARASGSYLYKAGFSGSKNHWRQYSSFEVIIDGEQEVKIAGIGATLDGPAYISGLYSGTITYVLLKAGIGGYVQNGRMIIEYNHPTQGLLIETWDAAKAGGYLQSVVLDGKEEFTPLPPYEEGNG